MALRPQDRERGLSALNDARATRRRAVVLGKVRVREVATRFWLLTFAGILIFAFAYYRYAKVELEARKAELLARQRAVREAMGSAPAELRGRAEGWIASLAQPEWHDVVRDAADLDAISRAPGLYVRMFQTEAAAVGELRAATKRSLHDGFTSCLFVGRKGDPAQGTACKTTSQCGPGEICNGWSVCAPPSQPYNLRLVSEGLRVLEPAWRENLEASSNEFEVRAMELDLEDLAKHEVPAVVEVVRRSRHFTAVLDELPEGGIPDPTSAELAELRESDRDRLQAVGHFIRVGIWDLKSAEQLVALRVRAEGRFVAMGRRSTSAPKVRRAQQRQANNCAAAREVRERLLLARRAPGAPPRSNDPVSNDPGSNDLGAGGRGAGAPRVPAVARP